MGVHSTGLSALHRSCACGVPQRQKGEGPALRTGQRVSPNTSLIIARRRMSQAPSETGARRSHRHSPRPAFRKDPWRCPGTTATGVSTKAPIPGG